MKKFLLFPLAAVFFPTLAFGQSTANNSPLTKAERESSTAPLQEKGAVITGLLPIDEGQLTQDGVSPNEEPLSESLIHFESLRAELKNVDNLWQVWDQGRLIKDFGRQENRARECFWMIRELGLTERGIIGSPRPIMEYWLCNGRAPTGTVSGLRTFPFGSDKLQVRQMQGQWCLCEGNRILFNFGAKPREAQLGRRVIESYGFNQLGYVGGAVPTMIIFLSGPRNLASGQFQNSPSRDTRPEVKEPLHREELPKDAFPKRTSSDPRRKEVENAMLRASVLQGRQLSLANASLGSIAPESQIAFDWRKVEIRRDKGTCKLIAGQYTLIDFGVNDQEAEQALQVIQYYRFTEKGTVGRGSSAFTYYLVNGEAPKGVLFGVGGIPFRPETLRVKQEGNEWVLGDYQKILFHFGDKEEDARTALRIIQQYRFTHLCRIGHSDSHVLNFLIRSP